MAPMQDMKKKSGKASAFLKGFANADRLRILCVLAEGEKSVTRLMKETGIAQTSMSQHLSKLKAEGIVIFRREHRTLYYSISDNAVVDIMRILYQKFCSVKGGPS